MPPQAETYPAGFKPIEEEYPAGFRPIDEAKPPVTITGHGATGSWEPDLNTRAGKAVTDFEKAHPIITAPVRALTNLGIGATDAAGNMLSLPGQVYHAATDTPTSKEEEGIQFRAGPMGLAAHRLLINPSVQNAQDWWEKAKNDPDRVQAQLAAIRAVPVAGPVAAGLIERAIKGDPFGAAGEAAGYELAPHAGGAVLEASSKVHPFVADLVKRGQAFLDPKASPQSLFTKGVKPSDIKIQKHLDAGLSEMKQGKIDLGQGRLTVDEGLRNLDHRTGVNNSGIQKLVDPQETVVVPGSGARMRQAQLDAIPNDVLNDPARHTEAVNRINSYHPNDFTIGELNQLRSELGATQSSFYGKDTSGALTMDAGIRATDIARGNAARSMFYHGMDNYGLGGGVEAAELNSRIGSIIHMKDALEAMRNEARATEGSPFNRNVTRPVRRALGAPPINVNEHLDAAVNGWKKTPTPVWQGLEPRVTGTAGAQSDLIPMDNNPNNLLQPPPRTSSTISPETFGAQQAAGQAERAAAPATTSGVQPELGMTRGPATPTTATPVPQGNLDMSNYSNSRSMFDQTTPEEDYLTHINRQKLWSAGAPTPAAGQLSLEEGMPPRVMGLDTTPGPKTRLTAAEAKKIIEDVKARVKPKNPPARTSGKSVGAAGTPESGTFEGETPETPKKERDYAAENRRIEDRIIRELPDRVRQPNDFMFEDRVIARIMAKMNDPNYVPETLDRPFKDMGSRENPRTPPPPPKRLK
ncbi:MAG: hypothetical protein ACREJN_08840 [Nitrospiraceae bacterium]